MLIVLAIAGTPIWKSLGPRPSIFFKHRTSNRATPVPQHCPWTVLPTRTPIAPAPASQASSSKIKTPSAATPVPPPPIRTPRSQQDLRGRKGRGEDPGIRRRERRWRPVCVYVCARGWVGVVEGREFRTANYVNCRCCKLPSQFAFILHTIHTVPAHLAPESIHSDTVTSFAKETTIEARRGRGRREDPRPLGMERDPRLPVPLLCRSFVITGTQRRRSAWVYTV